MDYAYAIPLVCFARRDCRYRWKDLATTSRREGQGLSNADWFAGAGLKQSDQREKAAVLAGAMRMIVNDSRYSLHVRMYEALLSQFLLYHSYV